MINYESCMISTMIDKDRINAHFSPCEKKNDSKCKRLWYVEFFLCDATVAIVRRKQRKLGYALSHATMNLSPQIFYDAHTYAHIMDGNSKNEII